MVRLISAMVLLASASCTLAAPSPVKKQVEARDSFSFEEWVKGIIADPTGDHLSASEAVEAAHARRSIGGMNKRDNVSCNDGLHPRASLADATSCVRNLAARGGENCHINYGSGSNLVSIGLANIHGVTQNRAGSTLLCNVFAVSAARILDICTHPGDTTIEGSNFPNDHIELFLSLDP